MTSRGLLMTTETYCFNFSFVTTQSNQIFFLMVHPFAGCSSRFTYFKNFDREINTIKRRLSGKNKTVIKEQSYQLLTLIVVQRNQCLTVKSAITC